MSIAAALLSKVTSAGVSTGLDAVGNAALKIRSAITGELPPDKKAEIEKALIELDGELAKAKSSIIVAEANGASWLQRNWRPLMMMVIIAIVANNYIIFPYLNIFFPEHVKQLELPDKLFTLMEIGLGGYIVGRTVEKFRR